MIEFSRHALEQLKSRRISKNLVIETIRNPQNKSGSFRGRRLRQRRFGDKMLEAVIKTEGSKILVITAYFLKEEKDEN